MYSKHDKLCQNEEVVYCAKTSKAILITPVVRTIVIICLSIYWIKSDNPFLALLGAFLISIGTIINIVSIVLTWMRTRGCPCIVTNKRIMTCRGGMFHRVSRDFYLDKCQGASLYQNYLGRIFDYGNVIVTTGGVTDCFSNVAHPTELRNIINSLL